MNKYRIRSFYGLLGGSNRFFLKDAPHFNWILVYLWEMCQNEQKSTKMCFVTFKIGRVSIFFTHFSMILLICNKQMNLKTK